MIDGDNKCLCFLYSLFIVYIRSLLYIYCIHRNYLDKLEKIKIYTHLNSHKANQKVQEKRESGHEDKPWECAHCALVSRDVQLHVFPTPLGDGKRWDYCSAPKSTAKDSMCSRIRRMDSKAWNTPCCASTVLVWFCFTLVLNMSASFTRGKVSQR